MKRRSESAQEDSDADVDELARPSREGRGGPQKKKADAGGRPTYDG
jgi:hypothetical protein